MASLQLATLGGGCYWCLEAFYQRVKGVEKVVSGFSGGHVANPSYEAVSGGTTGHAEVVQLSFDPSLITYQEILEIFFAMHDPTTLNRQGHDIGEQYRSVILYHDENQKEVAEDAIKHFAADLYKDPVVTQLLPFDAFYEGPDYHQDFYNKNPGQSYCTVVIDPKIQKLRAKFAEKLK